MSPLSTLALLDSLRPNRNHPKAMWILHSTFLELPRVRGILQVRSCYFISYDFIFFWSDDQQYRVEVFRSKTFLESIGKCLNRRTVNSMVLRRHIDNAKLGRPNHRGSVGLFCLTALQKHVKINAVLPGLSTPTGCVETWPVARENSTRSSPR